MTAFTLADFRAGQFPPKGWDCADAIRDGWTSEEITHWLRAIVAEDIEEWAPARGGAAAQPVAAARAATARITDQDIADILQSMPLAVDAEIETGSEVELARRLAAALRLAFAGNVLFAEGRFWVFAGTAWRELHHADVVLTVQRYDRLGIGRQMKPIKLGHTAVSGIIKQLAPILERRGFFDQPAVALNAENTVISLDAAGRVLTGPHEPTHRFRFTIPANFELHTDMAPAEGSMLRRLLDGAFGGDADADDKIRLLGEILGAAAFGLATRVPQPKAFVFLGETASNGKSTIASLLSCLLPEDAVSHVPPSAFEDERRIINLAGKAANIADELSGAALSGENLKAAVTGNPIEGRDLYKSAMTFVPRAIHVFTTNKLPHFSGGMDRGLQRRLVVLRFNRPIAEKDIIPDIVERIRRDELDTLLGMAIAGAQRLVRNRGYTIPASSKDALRGWLLLDPLNEWFEQRVRPVAARPMEGWPSTKQLFQDFREWAIGEGHEARFLPPVNTFSQRLKALPGVVLQRTAYKTEARGVVLVSAAASWED